MSERDRRRPDDEPPEQESPEQEPPAKQPERKEPPETAREPAPGIRHEPEPSGDNLIPSKEGPGTL